MLICIDGSGPYTDFQYAYEFRNSFVRNLWRNYDATKYYHRGPSTAGHECQEIFDDALRNIVGFRQRNREDTQIIIVGWSRGAAIAIELAWELQTYRDATTYDGTEERMRYETHLSSFTIPCMILFDAVDRNWSLGRTSQIPSIVQNCYHAIRDPNVHSRDVFGYAIDGEHPSQPGVNYVARTFFCTHAGMGGTPWTGDHPVMQVCESVEAHAEYVDCVGPTIPIITQEQDIANAEQIRIWMNNNIVQFGNDLRI